MKETIDLLRQLIIFYYTEKDVSKVLSLLSQDIKCFDISSERNVDGIENVEALLNEDFYQSTMSYSVDIYQEETILDGADRGIAAICFVIHTETAEVKCRIMGVSKLENNEIKLSVLNTTLLHHEEKRDLIQVILQENELRSRIQLLDDTTAGGMMGGYLEPGFPFYFINKRMLTYLGYDSEQEFVDDIQGMIDNCMHPDNRAEVGREVERQIIESGEYQVEYRMRKKDGSYIWVHDIGRKMTVSGGREAITSVCYDITREKEHIQLLDSLVDNANGGVALYKVEEDWRMTPLYASAGVGALADLDEAEYMELCQDDAMKSIYEEDRAGVMSAIREAVLNNKVTTLTYRVPDKNGGYIWINGMFSKSGEQDGRPVMRAVYT
ncbi:MAG: PAS domain S-box protein, partial [Clostridia bacterium]|nr:PAS domain S-box protein [Clostridia bacterium]